MIEYTDSLNLNAPIVEDSNRANAGVANTTVLNNTSGNPLRCPRCRSLIIIDTRNAADLLDLNMKRHFCSNVDRILHEVQCVTEIQQIIEYYNQCELSSFRPGLKMDD